MRGYVSSAEMAMLNSVLDEVCLERGTSPGPDHDFLAAGVVNLFMSGASEPAELLSALLAENSAKDWIAVRLQPLPLACPYGCGGQNERLFRSFMTARSEDFPRNFALWLVAGSGPKPPALPIRRRYFKCRASPNRVASDSGRPPRGWPHQSRSQSCCYDD